MVSFGFVHNLNSGGGRSLFASKVTLTFDLIAFYQSVHRVVVRSRKDRLLEPCLSRFEGDLG